MVDIKTQRRNNKAKGNQVFILELYPEEETCNGTYAFGEKMQRGGTNNTLISISHFSPFARKQRGNDHGLPSQG